MTLPRSLLPFLPAALAASPAVVYAQAAGDGAESVRTLPELVVTASRVPLPAEEIGSAATVISRREIEDSRVRIASDILRRAPGVAVSRSGGPGAQTYVRIRGAEANHVQVRIDGIEVGDPMDGNAFNFAHLPAAGIDRVTVLRGPQSALYGSDALAGTIDVRSRRGAGPLAIDGFAEGGSFGTATAGAWLGAGGERGDYALAATSYRTDGFDVSGAGGDADGYRNISASFVGALRPDEAIEIETVLRHIRADVSFDPGDNESDERFLYGRLGATLRLLDGMFEQRVEAGLADAARTYYGAGRRTGRYDGKRVTLGAQSHVFLETRAPVPAEHRLIAAYERERADFDWDSSSVPVRRSAAEDSVIGEYRLGLDDRLFLAGAVRRDDDDDFADTTTWRATAALLVPDLAARFHASYGTGITNPTVFERFGFIPDSFAGNPNLRPETSRGYDFGVEAELVRDRLTVDLTWFAATLKDEIAMTFADGKSSVENDDGESKRSGFELSITGRPSETLSVAGSYTYTRSRNADGSREVRRPRHSASLNATRSLLGGRAKLDLGVIYSGGRQDEHFPPPTYGPIRVRLKPYILLGIVGSYRIDDRVELFGRVENALDRDYEDVFSYATPGIAGYLGLRVRSGPS